MRKNKTSQKNYDLQIKVLLLGDSGVGKSSLLMRYATNEFSENLMGTAGIDLRTKIIQLNDTNVKLEIWDSAGQEKYRSISTKYIQKVMGILLIFDVSDRKTFLQLDDWLQQIEENTNKEGDIQKMLIGNKIDIEERKKEGQQLADKYNIKYHETSAKESNNVNLVFYEIALDIFNNKNIMMINQENLQYFQKNDKNLEKLDSIKQVNLLINQDIKYKEKKIKCNC